MLATAAKDNAAIVESERLENDRRRMARTVELDVEGLVAEMIADIRLRMQEQSLTQQDVAERCGWTVPVVAAYLTGAKESAKNLAKLARAVGCVWRLQEVTTT